MRTRTTGLGGLGLALISAATFGTSGSFADPLLVAGWTPGAAVATRITLAAAILTLPGVLGLRGRWALLRQGWRSIAAFGLVAVAGCQLCFFYAVDHLSVGVALLLEYSGTLIVVLWLWVRHGQRPGWLIALGGLATLAGLVLVLDLTGSQRVDPVGVLWGLGAATGLACFFLVSARTDNPLSPISTVWAGMSLGAAALLVAGFGGLVPFAASTAPARFAHFTTSWVVPVLGLALVAAVIAYTVGMAAARRLGARLASFVGLLEVLFAVLTAWLLLDQRPGPQQLVGGALVLAGIALIRAAEATEGGAEPTGPEPLPETGVSSPA